MNLCCTCLYRVLNALFSPQEYAVKIVSLRVDCTREVELLKLCQGHPNIVKLIEVIQVISNREQTMNTKVFTRAIFSRMKPTPTL